MTPDHQRRIQQRYMRDAVPVRLGGIAANLSRVCSFCKVEGGKDLVASVIEESAYFIEWTAAELEVGVAHELTRLRDELRHWQDDFETIWKDGQGRRSMGESANAWSDRVLAFSGLLNEPR